MICASVALPSGSVYDADMLSFHFLVSTWVGLCSSACVRNEGAPSFWWDWFWAFAMVSPFSGSSVRGCFPHLLGTKALPTHLMCLPSGCGHPLSQVCLFVTLNHERRFTLVVVPSRCGHPFSGRVVVFIHPPSDRGNFLLMVAAPLSCLSF